MAEGDTAAAAARVDEADAARLPRIKATAFGTISPKIECLDAELHGDRARRTSRSTFNGVFGGAQLDVTQPLYTFGKIAHARRAARAGLDAQRALADEAAGDLAVDAARAYWGVKLARELGGMLDDGIDEIAQGASRGSTSAPARTRRRSRIASASRCCSPRRRCSAPTPRRRATGARGPARAHRRRRRRCRRRRARGRSTARVPARRGRRARARRPSRRGTGAIAADELAAMARSYYCPDLALVGSACDRPRAGRRRSAERVRERSVQPQRRRRSCSRCSGQLEPWTVKARVDRAARRGAQGAARSGPRRARRELRRQHRARRGRGRARQGRRGGRGREGRHARGSPRSCRPRRSAPPRPRISRMRTSRGSRCGRGGHKPSSNGTSPWYASDGPSGEFHAGSPSSMRSPMLRRFATVLLLSSAVRACSCRPCPPPPPRRPPSRPRSRAPAPPRSSRPTTTIASLLKQKAAAGSQGGEGARRQGHDQRARLPRHRSARQARDGRSVGQAHARRSRSSS